MSTFSDVKLVYQQYFIPTSVEANIDITTHSDNFGQTWGGGQPTPQKCHFFGVFNGSPRYLTQNNRGNVGSTSPRCVKTSTTILRRGPSSSWSNSTSKQARDLVFLNHRFLAMANHLEPFPEASDGPEGQEQPVWAVGDQGALHGVTQLLSELET